jgi:hypothetical protein
VVAEGVVVPLVVPLVVVVVGAMHGTMVVEVVVLASLGPQTVGLSSPNNVLYICATAGAATSAP